MKAYKPKHKIGDIVKWENESTCVHDLILDLGKEIGVDVYEVLTLDSGQIEEDLDCRVYDVHSIKVA